jgi:hypothetical protein
VDTVVAAETDIKFVFKAFKPLRKRRGF